MLTALLTDLLLGLACEGLDARAFRTREACHRLLERAGELARPAVARFRATGAEGRRRARQLLARLEFTPRAEVEDYLAGRRKAPWIFLHESYDGEAYGRSILAVTPSTPAAMPDWPNYREATRRWIREVRAEGWTCAEVLGRLRHMQYRETGWYWP